MTTLKEVEAQARRLSPAERIILAKRLLADEESVLGSFLVDGGLSNSSDPDPDSPTNGTPASGPHEPETPIEEDPLWELGRNPVDIGLTDASVAHDRYLYRMGG